MGKVTFIHEKTGQKTSARQRNPVATQVELIQTGQLTGELFYAIDRTVPGRFDRG
jgi:hypothetical protein